jgi:hypothetical protein
LHIFPTQAFHAPSSKPFPNPDNTKKIGTTGNGGCAHVTANPRILTKGAEMAMPRCPKRMWILLTRKAAVRYPARGLRKRVATTV